MLAEPHQPHSLRIGTAPVNWNNNDLEHWRPFVPFPKILDEMREAGYSATEWDESFGKNVYALNRERSARGMTFTGAYRWLDFVDNDSFERDLLATSELMKTLRDIGATHLIVADSLRPHRVAMAGSVPEDGSASLDNAAYGRVARNLSRLATAARRFDIAVHYHNHVGSYVESPGEVLSLVERLPDTGVDLCFDTGHYAFGGGDSLAFLEERHRSIGYLHLKDVDPKILANARSGKWTFLESLRSYIFSPIGMGNARIPEIIQLLAKVEFPHYVIIEQDTCEADSTSNARANLDMVRKFEATADST